MRVPRAFTRPTASALAAACAIHAIAAAGCYRKPEYTPPSYVRPTSEPIPVLASIVPTTGPVAGGTSVTLSGSGFRPGAAVNVGGVPAAVSSVSPGEVVFITPAGATGPADVEIVNADGTRAAAENGFAFDPAGPFIECVSPDKAPHSGGSTFFVCGSGFDGSATVLVAGTQCSGVEVLHAGLIKAVAPAGPQGAADVVVSNPLGPPAIAFGGMNFVDVSAGGCLVLGKAEFEKRQVTRDGLTGSYAPAPARGVEIEVHVQDDPIRIVSCHADRHGRFGVLVLPGPSMTARLRANAKAAVAAPAISVMVMDNMTDRAVYAMESDVFQIPAGAAVEQNVLAPAGSPPIAGAFNIMSVCVSCARLVREETGAELPMLRAFWEPGNSWTVWTSAFWMADLGAGPVPVIQILGGIYGGEEYTDTDEFDDPIIAHEFGHFAQSSLSTDSSPGGRHGGEMLVPNLAFSEGFASWFGCASLESPHYRDTSGRGEWGSMLLDFSAESVWFQCPVVKGIGSEETVLEVLWDLFDGGKVPDDDGDGFCVGFGEILKSVAAFDPSRDYPCLDVFFDELTGRGAVTVQALQALFLFPEEQGLAYPPAQGAEFPRALLQGIAVEGFVDAVNPWYPPNPSWKFRLASCSGNPYNATNGFNSRRYHVFTLAAEADVTLRLDVSGSGAWPENLDLYLLDLRNAEIQRSSTSWQTETISRRLAAGTYVVEVRGFYYADPNTIKVNAAGYSLKFE